MQTIQDTLDRTAIGSATRFRNLRVYPLLSAVATSRDYLTLDEAQALDGLSITEVSESGSVPELRLVNRLAQPVFLLDGEELVGAKQNRVLNLSVLAPAGRTITIPVSCVEQGRWSHSRPDFGGSNRAQFAWGRARKMASVSASLSRSGQARSDQGAVWEDIQRKSASLRTHSATSAMADLYESHRAAVDDYVSAIGAAPGQVGVAFAIDDRLVGLDLFDHADTLSRLLPKLVRSYALDAIDPDPATGAAAAAEPETGPAGLLQALAAARIEVHPACGAGEDVRLEGETVVAGALVADGRVIHLAAFRRDAEAGRNGGRVGALRRASLRRRARQG